MTSGPDTIAYPIGLGPVTTRILECNGGGEPVLLVHGLGARADRWRATLTSFGRAGFRALAVDLPGHGFATKGPGAPASVPEFADMVEALLDALELTRIHLVGTSLGGHVLATVATRRPDRVASLVLVGAVGLMPLGRDAGDAIRANVRKTDRDAIVAKMRFVFENQALITDAFVEEEWRVNNSPGAAESFEILGDYIAGKIDTDNVLDALKGVAPRPPLLLVWGAGDKAVPPTIGREAAEALGCRLVLIPGAGHAPYMERPEAFEAEVLPFLRQASVE